MAFDTQIITSSQDLRLKPGNDSSTPSTVLSTVRGAQCCLPLALLLDPKSPPVSKCCYTKANDIKYFMLPRWVTKESWFDCRQVQLHNSRQALKSTRPHIQAAVRLSRLG